MIRFICTVFFSLEIISTLFAQKGRSPEKPWSKGILDGFRYFNNNDAINTEFSNLKFGNWSFRSNHKKAELLNPKSEHRDVTPNYYFKSEFNKVEWFSAYYLSFYDSVYVNAVGPQKKSFSFYFSFADSMFEKYKHHGFSHTKEQYEENHFWKEAKGTVLTSQGGSARFYINLVYDDKRPSQGSYILTNSDSIIIKPILNPNLRNIEKRNSNGSSYDGFLFYLNGKEVGGANRKVNLLLESKYEYWLKPELDKSSQESIASVLFVIVGFIK